MESRTFYDEEWSFTLNYPAGWEIIYRNEPAGSWTIPIAVAGADTGGGRPCFMVNARRGEVLEGSSTMPVYAVGPDGRPIKMPSTPAEFIVMNRESVQNAFPGFQFISAEEIRLAEKPAARLVYSYSGQKGRVTEESITLFGVGVTFQFICEMPSARNAEFRPQLQRILESFRIGRAEPMEAPAAAAPAELSPAQLYNEGVRLYRNGDFRAAMEVFQRCFHSEEYRLQAAYARALCQQELGLSIEIPPELDDPEAAGPAYVASNLACHLAGRGYPAALTKQGRTSEIQSRIDGALYLVSIISGFGFGGFFTMAWRKEGDKSIPLTDPSANPHPTTADKLVISLVSQASSLPPAPLPEGGLPTALEEPATAAAPAAPSPVTPAPAAPPAPAPSPQAAGPAPAAALPASAAPAPSTAGGKPPTAAQPVAAPSAAGAPPAMAQQQPMQLDLISPAGKARLEGSVLVVGRKRFSPETVSLPLDGLQLAYLFLPQQFQWRVVQSRVNYRYLNLDALEDEDFADLQALLAQAHQFLRDQCKFVLADYAGHVVTISWKKLSEGGIDPLVELQRYRAARRQKLALWRQGNPAATIAAKRASLRGDISLNAAGVVASNGKFIPWNALEELKLNQQQVFLSEVCFFGFVPVRGSGYRGFTTAVDPKQVEAGLAELDFWGALDQARQPDGATTAAAAPPAPVAAPNSGLATFSLVAGALGWSLLPGLGAIVGIITGHLALRAIRSSGGRLGGKGRARIGLLLGYAEVVLVAVILVLSLPGLAPALGGGQAGRQPVATLAVRQVVVTPTPAATAAATTQALDAAAAQTRATAQALQSTLAESSAWPIISFDPFDTNVNDWPMGNYSDQLIILTETLTQGKYRWQAQAVQGVLSTAALSGTEVADFRLTVEAQRISGPESSGYGLEFRMSDDFSSRYTFILLGGQYLFSVLSGGSWTTLIGPTTSPAIQTAGPNRIAVVARGTHFSFFINDQYVAEAEDNRLARGRVGLALQLANTGDTGIFDFDNFELHAPTVPASLGGMSKQPQPTPLSPTPASPF